MSLFKKNISDALEDVKDKKIIISTNLTPTELRERYEERIFSRLIMYVDTYKFVGEDLRW